MDEKLTNFNKKFAKTFLENVVKYFCAFWWCRLSLREKNSSNFRWSTNNNTFCKNIKDGLEKKNLMEFRQIA